MASQHRGAGDIVFLAAIAIALIIAAHVVFVLIGANPANSLVSTDADWADTLAAWFKDLFTPHDYKIGVFLNYGVAAVFYLIVGEVLHRVINGMSRSS
jgi:hypothetical protein